MSKGKRGLGVVEFAGKVKAQTFKQFQLERLIKDSTVLSASKLAEIKELEFQRGSDFRLLLQMKDVTEDLTQPNQNLRESAYSQRASRLWIEWVPKRVL